MLSAVSLLVEQTLNLTGAGPTFTILALSLWEASSEMPAAQAYIVHGDLIQRPAEVTPA